jgi:hypothetical protein
MSSGCVPSWQWKLLRAPYTYRNCDQSLKAFVCNVNAMQNLARPKVV